SDAFGNCFSKAPKVRLISSSCLRCASRLTACLFLPSHSSRRLTSCSRAASSSSSCGFQPNQPAAAIRTANTATRMTTLGASGRGHWDPAHGNHPPAAGSRIWAPTAPRLFSVSPCFPLGAGFVSLDFALDVHIHVECAQTTSANDLGLDLHQLRLFKDRRGFKRSHQGGNPGIGLGITLDIDALIDLGKLL